MVRHLIPLSFVESEGRFTRSQRKNCLSSISEFVVPLIPAFPAPGTLAASPWVSSEQGGQGKRRAGRGQSLHLRRSCFGMRRLLVLCDQSISASELGPDHVAICPQRSPNGRH